MKNIQKFRFNQISKLKKNMSMKFKKSTRIIRSKKTPENIAMLYYYKAIKQCTIMNTCHKIMCFNTKTYN